MAQRKPTKRSYTAKLYLVKINEDVGLIVKQVILNGYQALEIIEFKVSLDSIIRLMLKDGNRAEFMKALEEILK